MKRNASPSGKFSKGHQEFILRCPRGLPNTWMSGGNTVIENLYGHSPDGALKTVHVNTHTVWNVFNTPSGKMDASTIIIDLEKICGTIIMCGSRKYSYHPHRRDLSYDPSLLWILWNQSPKFTPLPSGISKIFLHPLEMLLPLTEGNR